MPEYETYHPSERERANGRWAVVEEHDSDDTQYHVMPTFGRHHVINKSCWCNPRMEEPVCIHGEEIQ